MCSSLRNIFIYPQILPISGMATPTKLGVPLKTVVTALGRSLNTTIATQGPGFTRVVSALDKEVLDDAAQRIAEEADGFPEDVHIARVEYGNSIRIPPVRTNGIP